MKAMTYRGPYRIRVDEKDRPAIEHPNDAIVRVELAAICGSDGLRKGPRQTANAASRAFVP